MSSARPTLGYIVSVNVGKFATLRLPHGDVMSAIVKRPQADAVSTAADGLAGDDRAAHGGPDRAVCVYALEDYAWWEVVLQRPLGPGIFGENLTTFGFDPNESFVGDRWAVGSAVLEVSQPRLPCRKLAARLQQPTFVRTFAQHVRPGSYLRIVSEGTVSSGDPVVLASRPPNAISIRDLFRTYIDPTEDASRLLSIPQLNHGWRVWAEHAARGRRPGSVPGAVLGGPVELGGLIADEPA